MAKTFMTAVSMLPRCAYKTNMDFLKPEVRDYFFRQYPGVYSKIDDLPPAKYNPGSNVSNSLISSGCIINGQVDASCAV